VLQTEPSGGKGDGGKREEGEFCGGSCGGKTNQARVIPLSEGKICEKKKKKKTPRLGGEGKYLVEGDARKKRE